MTDKENLNTEEIIDDTPLEDIKTDENIDNSNDISESETTQIDELSILNDKHLRLLAEYDNFRKRSIREKESAFTDGIGRAVTALLPVYDNLERALSLETTDEALRKGIELTMKQFDDSFQALNVKVIEANIGDTFNPELHNAVMHISDENLGENVIAQVFTKGFMIGDKVIRHTVLKSAN